MKLGCGCLAGLVLLGAPLVILGSAAWVATNALQPVPVQVAQTTPADGVRAQQKIYEMVQRAARSDGRDSSVILSEREINAFLARHVVKTADIPLDGMAVRLIGGDAAEIGGQLPLSYLVAEPPLAPLGTRLPQRWLDRPVSLRVRARVRIEAGAAQGRRRLRLELVRSWVGRQPLPVIVLRVVTDPAVLRLLSWEVPDSVDAVTIAPGRATVRIASPR